MQVNVSFCAKAVKIGPRLLPYTFTLLTRLRFTAGSPRFLLRIYGQKRQTHKGNTVPITPPQNGRQLEMELLLKFFG